MQIEDCLALILLTAAHGRFLPIENTGSEHPVSVSKRLLVLMMSDTVCQIGYRLITICVLTPSDFVVLTHPEHVQTRPHAPDHQDY